MNGFLRRFGVIALLAAAALTFTTPVFSDDPSAVLFERPGTLSDTHAALTITGAELKAHVEFLASDSLKGRATGTPECREAAEYIAKQFAQSGLAPFGDKDTAGACTFFQTIRVSRGVELEETGNTLAIKSAGAAADFRPERDFVPFPMSAVKSAENLEIVFVGYGITDTKGNYDDYAGIDVTGKAVVMFRYDPSESTAEIYQAPYHAGLDAKLSNASARGAAAVVVINGPESKSSSDDALFNLRYGFMGTGKKTIPFVHAKRAFLEKLLADTGRDMRKLQKSIDESKTPCSFRIPDKTLDVAANLRRTSMPCANVVALLEGSDEKLKHEYVVIGAHYDHIGLGFFGSRLGMKGAGKIHNGADDNASGTASLIEIAEAFGCLKNRPRRSVIFVAFTGEEAGLLGSQHFMSRPPVGAEQLAAMLNFDMVGRSTADRLDLMGTGFSPVFTELYERLKDTAGLDIRNHPYATGPSDIIPFRMKGIPTLMFFTGLHREYHTPDDKAHLLNYPAQEKITRFATRFAIGLANSEKEVGKYQSSARTRPILGIVLQAGDTNVVMRVQPGSVADRGGIVEGDEIVEFNGVTVATRSDIATAMSKIGPGGKVAVKVARISGQTRKIVDLELNFQ